MRKLFPIWEITTKKKCVTFFVKRSATLRRKFLSKMKRPSSVPNLAAI